MGFQTLKYFFRKGIFYPFKQGIAFYSSLNNSRDIIFFNNIRLQRRSFGR